MHVLDRVLERDDVDRLRFVDLVENGREGGCFSAARCAGDENEAGFFFGNFRKDSRQPQCFDRRHFALQFAKDHCEMTLLPENIYAETRLVIERIAAVARAAGQIIVNQTAIALHQGQCDLLGLVGSQCLDRWLDINWFEFAVILNLERMTNRKV